MSLYGCCVHCLHDGCCRYLHRPDAGHEQPCMNCGPDDPGRAVVPGAREVPVDQAVLRRLLVEHWRLLDSELIPVRSSEWALALPAELYSELRVALAEHGMTAPTPPTPTPAT